MYGMPVAYCAKGDIEAANRDEDKYIKLKIDFFGNLRVKP